MQASAVPCERVFSSAAETDTKRRNRLSPAFMEVLQILKFIISQDRALDFVGPHLASEDELRAPIVDVLVDAAEGAGPGGSARSIVMNLLSSGRIDEFEQLID
jgi:hypothetical protein